MYPAKEASKSKETVVTSFFKNHGIYSNDLNRDFAVAQLYKNAYIVINDTILISKSTEIKKEVELIFQQDFHNPKFSTSEIAPTISDYTKKSYLENLKISIGFEVCIRANLLSQNYLIHQLKHSKKFKTLSKKQQEEPVKKEEYFAIEDYFDDETKKRKMLRGLNEKTINYNIILTKNKYKQSILFPKEIIEIANKYRKLRNTVIHFPTNGGFTIIHELNESASQIKEFTNEYIVKEYNNISSKYDRKLGTLEKLAL